MEGLNIQSSLGELVLHTFVVDASCPGLTAYQHFENNPVLPGVIPLQQGDFIGMISRRRFLEAMGRAYGRELFLGRSLAVLCRFTLQETLCLPMETPITEAARLAIARPSELLYEPIVVVDSRQDSVGYHLIDIHDVLQAQSTIHQLTVELLKDKTRSERRQTEKLASLGKLMAGVAHEIRNPVNFIWGNLKYVSEYASDLTRLIRALAQEVQAPTPQLATLQQDIDLDFILHDLPKVVQSMETGTERLRNLVTSLRTFSRMDEAKRSPTDLHQSLDSTLLILNARIKEGILVQKEYGDIPIINCYGGQIGQVFMNIISNAIDALLEHTKTRVKPLSADRLLDETRSQPVWEPQISIKTQRRTDLPEDVTPRSWEPGVSGSIEWISICVQDNGPGIPVEIQARVFEDFFTTKPSGEGTGLGLSITKQIVTEQHQGHLVLRSPYRSAHAHTAVQGTEFEILLPIQPLEGDVPLTRMTHTETGTGISSRPILSSRSPALSDRDPLLTSHY